MLGAAGFPALAFVPPGLRTVRVGAVTMNPLSPSVHPDMLSPVEAELTIDRDTEGKPVHDPALSAARGALARLHEGGTSLVEAESQLRERDGARLAPADAHRLRITAEKTMGALRKAVDSAHESIAQRREAVEGEIAAALQLPEHRTSIVHASRAADVRAALRAMSANERAEAIRAAITAGDVEAVASVLSASPLASGLSRDDHERLKADAEHRFAPRLTAIRAALDKTRTILTRAADLTQRRFAPLIGEGDTPAARAEAAMRRAEMIGGAA